MVTNEAFRVSVKLNLCFLGILKELKIIFKKDTFELLNKVHTFHILERASSAGSVFMNAKKSNSVSNQNQIEASQKIILQKIL